MTSAPTASPTPTPWSYFLIRLLFKFVLKIFYGTIVVENAHLVPVTGKPCIVCANHSNSLTDALLLVTAIPSKRRGLLRLTAKSTQFGKKTFTSWLIESAGTLPLQRRKDFTEGKADNSGVMIKLVEALELGDAVCLFPEGMSRYHPSIAPLKTGVARMVSDALSRNRHNPDFEISVLTCSITYMHREHFRSDVLVTFNPPMVFTPKTHPELLAPVDYNNIRHITAQMHQQISSGTLDAPSWGMIRNAKLAAQIYVPLGTSMSLGDYVRVVRTFLEAFKLAEASAAEKQASESPPHECSAAEDREIIALGESLKAYQDQLVRWGIKDDRIRRPLARRTILWRMLVRLTWASVLLTISIPGLVLWLPVFITTFIGVHQFKSSGGPIWDTWDEIAQYKLVYGLLSSVGVWVLSTGLTLPVAPLTAVVVPATMWISLRWLEDAVSSFRAFATLVRLLCVGQAQLRRAGIAREDLHARVAARAVKTLGLPPDPEAHFAATDEAGKGAVGGGWASSTKYFSVRRRRKRDWNETLRLYDKVDYPDMD